MFVRESVVMCATAVANGRASEAGESGSALAERYITEGLRMDEHPQISFRNGALGRRAALRGTRLDVWQVVETLRNHANSVEQAAEYLNLPVEKVHAAMGYYAAHRDEVDAFGARASTIAERAETAWRAEQEILAT
jgi:uncharacterized protein (DUF433 family)